MAYYLIIALGFLVGNLPGAVRGTDFGPIGFTALEVTTRNPNAIIR